MRIAAKKSLSKLVLLHPKNPSCRDCKFSIWLPTPENKNKSSEHFQLKCIRFPYIKNSCNTLGISYENACDARMDEKKCGIQGKYFDPAIVPY